VVDTTVILDFQPKNAGSELTLTHENFVQQEAMESIRKTGMDVDERSEQDGREFLKRFLPVVNNQLKKGEYLCGDALTIADFNLIATIDPVELAEVDISEYPELEAYRRRLMAQDFYQKCFEAYSDCFAARSG
jgi:glutathione S-transferase